MIRVPQPGDEVQFRHHAEYGKGLVREVKLPWALVSWHNGAATPGKYAIADLWPWFPDVRR